MRGSSIRQGPLCSVGMEVGVGRWGRFDREAEKPGRVRQVGWWESREHLIPLSSDADNWGRSRALEEQCAGLRS